MLSHTHPMSDPDAIFTIDPTTRVISTNVKKIVLMRYDHNSEIFTFSIPQFVEGHDMSLCNKIEIHYTNINKRTREQSNDVYPVTDNLVFTWLLSGNATKYPGSLNFIVRFECVEDDGSISYMWHTDIFKNVTVSDGISNTESVIEDYSDILEQWKSELVETCTDYTNITNAPVKYLKSPDVNGNYIILRDLDSGTYILDGAFYLFKTDTASQAANFKWNFPVIIGRTTDKTYVQVLYPPRNTIQYVEITDDGFYQNNVNLEIEFDNLRSEIPDVPEWAMAETKPTYTAEEVGAMPADASVVKSVNGIVPDESGNVEIGVDDSSLGITGAAVGQIARITAVDSDGKPTAWEPVDISTPTKLSELDNDLFYYNTEEVLNLLPGDFTDNIYTIEKLPWISSYDDYDFEIKVGDNIYRKTDLEQITDKTDLSFLSYVSYGYIDIFTNNDFEIDILNGIDFDTLEESNMLTIGIYSELVFDYFKLLKVSAKYLDDKLSSNILRKSSIEKFTNVDLCLDFSEQYRIFTPSEFFIRIHDFLLNINSDKNEYTETFTEQIDVEVFNKFFEILSNKPSYARVHGSQIYNVKTGILFSASGPERNFSFYTIYYSINYNTTGVISSIYEYYHYVQAIYNTETNEISIKFNSIKV